MTLMKDGQAVQVYRGDRQPRGKYSGNQKIFGWHPQTVSGEGVISLDGAYNVPPDALVIDGKCVQTVGVWGTNLITNGDFSNGASDWRAISGSFSVADGAAVFLATAQNAEFKPVGMFDRVAGRKYYIKADVKATSISVGLSSATGGTDAVKYHSGSGNFESLSVVNTAVTSASTTYMSFIRDYRASGFDNIYVDNFIFIGLTAEYGAGTEPTAEQMDAYLAQYPNSWFDGSALLTTSGTPNSPSPTYPAPITTITGDLTITGTGKNLIPYPYYDGNSKTTRGVTFTVNPDGSVHAVGTATSDATFYINNAAGFVIPVGTYTFSGCPSGGDVDNGYYMRINYSGFVLSDIGAGATGTRASDTSSTVPIYIRVRAGATVNHTFYPQLEMSDTAVTPLGSVELCSLPDGTKDTYDAVTGVVTKRVGKYVGASGTSWEITDAAIDSPFMCDKILAGTLSGQTLTSPSACAPTVYYKLAEPYTIQLAPALPVVRTGIKTLSVSANLTPSFTATVKAMD